jgi:8-oxo-dGTP pyrophosphatase MutT (NUDIX family)
MSHIHDKPGQHDLTASAFIVHTQKNQKPRILLHRHKILNKLLQPGGHVELNENPWQAVLHEISEETGYKTAQLKVLQSAPNIEQDPSSNATYLPIPIIVSSHQFGDKDHFHDDLAFAFTTTELPAGSPGENESHDFYWVGLAELNTLDNQIIKNCQEICRYVLENFENWRAEDADKFGGAKCRK